MGDALIGLAVACTLAGWITLACIVAACLPA